MLTLRQIAADHGVSLDALRAALRTSHPDASPSEVIARARDIDRERADLADRIARLNAMHTGTYKAGE